MIKKIVYNQLRYYNNKDVIISLSGGVDSVVLLDIVNSLNLDLSIHLIHINYNHNKNSKKASYLCEKLAHFYNNKFILYETKIAEQNFESNAREFRYSKMNKYSDMYNIKLILTAQHLNDQIETVFMHQMLNSDWISKIGIREKNGKILRPLLDISKEKILEYAYLKNLTWVEDASNSNTKYLRNKIRIDFLPFYEKNHYNLKDELLMIANKSLKKFNKITKIINFDFQNNLLYHKNFIQVNNSIVYKYDVVEMKLFYQILLKNNFKKSITKSKQFWKNLNYFLLHANSGSFFYFNDQIVILKDRSKHFIYKKNYLDKIKAYSKNDKIKIYKFPFIWNDCIIRKSIKSDKENKTFFLPSEIIEKGLFARYWKHGDVCYSNFYKKNTKLKKIFINNKISLFEKHTIPILIDVNDDIVCVPGLYNRYNNKKNSIKYSFKRNI